MNIPRHGHLTDGFSLLELLVALAVFSLVVLALAWGARRWWVRRRKA